MKLKKLTALINNSSKPIEAKVQQQDIVYPATYAQENLWKIENKLDNNLILNLFFPIMLRGKLYIKALEKSIELLINNNQSFRTSFKMSENGLMQIIKSPNLIFKLNIIYDNLSDDLIKSIINKKLDLTNGPAFNINLLLINENEHLLLLIFHHIIFDGWSFEVFSQELSILYNSILDDKEYKPLVKEFDYIDFAKVQSNWLKSEECEQQHHYWMSKLKSIKDIELSFAKEIPLQITYYGDIIKSVVDIDLSCKIAELSLNLRISEFTILLSCFYILLRRFTSSHDICVGVPVANRNNNLKLEKTIGLLTNMLCLRNRILEDESFIELLDRVNKSCIDDFSNQEYPFEKLTNDLNQDDRIDRPPIFQIMFLYHTAHISSLKLKGLKGYYKDISYHSSEFEMTLWLEQMDLGIQINLIYNSKIFDEISMNKFIQNYCQVLEIITGNSNVKISQILDKMLDIK